MGSLVFYNFWHNGDIHVSRSFVRGMCGFLRGRYDFFYAHGGDRNIISDVVASVPLESVGGIDRSMPVQVVGGDVYVNTWYCAGDCRFHRAHGGCTFDTLYFLFEEICSFLGFSLGDISQDPSVFFPRIDYQCYDVRKVDEFNREFRGRKVLVSNGPALSGQACNFDFTDVVCDLAGQHPEVLWLLTSDSSRGRTGDCENILYTDDITGNGGRDLNEISYLSLACDLIVGRASGPFTFCLCADNCFNPAQKLVSFSRLVRPGGRLFLHGWGEGKIEYRAHVTEHRNEDAAEIYSIIEDLL
jgi:hypothetical protein